MSALQRAGSLAWVADKLKQVAEAGEIALNATDPAKREQAAYDAATKLAEAAGIGIPLWFLDKALTKTGLDRVFDSLRKNKSFEEYLKDQVAKKNLRDFGIGNIAEWGLKELRDWISQNGYLDPVFDLITKKAGSASSIPSPIAFDLDGDGIETVSVAKGGLFDHAADGFAELTGWIAPEDGLLVRDLNANGTIDSGRELFGSETLLSNGLRAANGFEALSGLDSNVDGVIDNSDATFAELRVWQDSDGDGYTSEGELFTLDEAGVKSINLSYTHSSFIDAQGNAHRQIGSYTTTDGQTRAATDVWVQTDAAFSMPTEWVDVPDEIALLPDAQGYGKVRDLQQAMAMDTAGELKALVTVFTQSTAPEDRDALVTQIIYHWTGVQNVDPASRASRMIYGNAIGDARKLEALEEFMGEEWVGVWCWGTRDPNPHGRAAPVLLQAWDELKALVYGQLMSQSHLSGLFQSIAYQWDAEAESVVGDLSAVAQKLATRIESDRDAGLADLGDFLYSLKGMGLLNRLDVASFKAELLLLGSDVAQTMDAVLNGWVPGGSTEEDDVLRGTEFNDLLDARGGNDRLLGRGGNDTLIGGSGNDVLDGGAGNDDLRGDTGADTYIFGRGAGNDTVREEVELGIQRDIVRFSGLTSADIQVAYGAQKSLIFTIRDTGETLTILTDGTDDARNGVGQYVFDDGSVWSHEDVLRATVAATTENDDVIHGSSAGDSITGQAGNDTLIGNGGNDVIDGGAGNDLLIASTGLNWIYENEQWRQERSLVPSVFDNGNDTYLFGRGYGQDTVIDGDYTVGNSDTLRFKEGVAPADVKFVRSGNDLVLAIRGSSDQVTLKQYFDEAWNGANGPYLIERIAFADGSVLSYANVQAILFAGSEEAEIIIGSRAADVLTGQGGDDVLLGGAGRDILDGGAGNDVLRGGGVIGWGNQMSDGNGEGDTYRFGRGDGNDTVIDDSWMAGETDRIELKAGVLPSDVRLERVRTIKGWQVSDDLKITIRDSDETLTVKNHFNESNRYAVEEIAFADGTLWDAEAIKSQSLLGESGNDELLGFNERDDLIIGSAGKDELIGFSGNDTLQGGDGNDLLEGGSGSDTYRFGLGDDQDMINEAFDTGEDVVELLSGVTTTDVTVRWTLQGDMAITLPDGSKLTVRGQANTWNTEQGIEQLRFTDGTVWNRSDLASRALAATDSDDAIVGGYLDDTLDGNSGDDHFQNLGGYDTYRFGIGDGQDEVEASAGRVLFKPGIGQNDVSFNRDGSDLIATVTTSGDAVRIKDWLNSWQRIDRFDFDNGASLTLNDVLAKLNIGEGAEILYGSPGEDVLVGTEKESTLYGREGNDVLESGAGSDQLYGETGDDTLDGGAGRDQLYGGEGNNSYRVATGMGLDIAVSESLTVANDTVVFSPGILPADVSVQLGGASGIGQAGDVGYTNLVIGIGGNDALVLRTNNWDDLGRGALQHFRFDDGTEWTLADVIARADGGKMGWQQRYWGDSTNLVGSQSDDDINDYTGQSVAVQARGNNDNVNLGAGNDRVSAGSGNDNVYSGAGEDLVAGQVGNDSLNTGVGDDVVVFNLGDGNDTLRTMDGTDTLSFGTTITPAMLSAAVDRNGHVMLLIDGGAGGAITLDNTRIDDLPGDLERVQFIDANGKVRIFDMVGWLRTNAGTLLSATLDAPLAFDGAGFELTGTVAPAGGLEAVAYAQFGDLFASANLTNNIPTDSDDVLYGTPSGDILSAGSGNDIALGLAGDDVILGGDGNDLIHGGDGDDMLEGHAGNDLIYGGWGADQLTGGTGNDQLFGEWGGDTYVYQLGHGEVIIDDDHHALNWGYGGGYGGGWDGGEGGYGGSIIDEASNILSFGPGIRPQDLRYVEQNGDLVIEFANHPGDRVILRGYEPNRATQTRSVDIIRFADGIEIVAENIEPTGKTEVAGDEGGWLDGTPLADTLIGGNGDDIVNGQGGADRLVGGVGSDTYRINKEWGSSPAETLIAETWREQDVNRIELQGEFNANDLQLEFDGSDLLLRLNDEGDVVRFAGFDPRAEGMQVPVSEINLTWYGVTLSFEDLLARGVRIIGTPNDDVLTGTALADWIEGRESDDTMSGGAGGDLYFINVDGGTDTIIDTESGDVPNTVVLPEGTTLDDVRLSFDAEGFLIIDLNNTGNRVRLSGFDPQNPLGPHAVERFRFGIGGDEVGYEELLARGFDIVGTDENDTLKGTTLTDRVRGGDGSDLVNATTGGDWLAGGAGKDTYVVQLGDGIVTIDDVAEEDAGNVLRFGPGIDPNDLRNNLRFEEDGNGGHVLLIPYGDEGDMVRLTGFDPQDVLGPHAVERFEFADGTAVDYATLVSWTLVVEGDNGGNALTGTNVGDRLYGYDGDDVLEPRAGSDELHGGTGNDLLHGAEGDDTYVFNKGDGLDTIIDSGATDFNYIRFGTDIRPEDIRHEWDGTTLVLHYSDDDVVRIENYYGSEGNPVILALAFEDGTVVSLTEQMNRAPVALQQLDDTIATEDQDFSLILPADMFSDPDASDEIQVVVKLANGDPLPAWLSFDPVSRTLSGKPTNDAVGDLAIVVEGKDHFGVAASIGFNISVQNTNDAPEVGTPLSDLRALEDSAFSFTLPAGSFRDVDVGDELAYTATLADGSPLPAWLTFDAQTGTFSGTPANGDVGTLQLAVTATDLAGASASQTFALEVTNTNDAPTVGAALAAQTATEDAAFTFTMPTDAFADADVGDRLSYSATLADGSALPAWLQLDAATGTFSGTPGNDHVGALEIRVTASDLAGASASQSFSLTVANANDAPVMAFALTNLQATEDASFAFTVPQDAFRDVDAGDTLTLSASLADGTALPAWLRFDAATRTFSGTPVNGDVGSVSVRLTASDVAGASASQTFAIGVSNVNDAPEIGTMLANQSGRAGMALSWQLPGTAFVDVDAGDVLTYSATLSDGSALPAWLAFDATTGTFSGNPASAGSYALRVTATDLAGASASQSFTLAVESGGGNQVPVTTPDTANVIEDRKLLAWGNVLANDRDPEGKRLSVANPGIRRGEYGVLTLLSNGTYAYVLDDCATKVQGLGAGETVTETFNYLASDGTQRSNGALTVTVQGTNDTPDLVRGLSDVQLAKGKAFSWKVPAGSFRDADRNDTLSYTATLSNGKALPSWLKFDAATQTFSGTAPANAKGSIDVRVTASDGHGECSTASDDFKVSFGNKTVVPTATKGNEGVGNGADAPPPGLGANINDGAGTAPGLPGRKHGGDRDDDPLGRFLDGFKHDNKSDQTHHSALPALDRRWFEQWGEQQQASGQAGQGQANHDVERHWAELTHALNRLDAERQSAPAWSHVNQGADLTGLAGWMQAGGNGARGGVDAVSLACGTGTQLKGFSGIKEGVGKLSW